VNHYLGDYLYYQDQFEASLAQYQAAIALKPDDASALFKAGVVLRDLNRYTEAAESLDKSIQLDPNQGDAHFNLAFVLSRLARTGEARAHLREAVRLQPEQVDRNNSLAAEIEAGTSR
jgi:tetratricopeptide (TPR) repeat protein